MSSGWHLNSGESDEDIAVAAGSPAEDAEAAAAAQAYSGAALSDAAAEAAENPRSGWRKAVQMSSRPNAATHDLSSRAQRLVDTEERLNELENKVENIPYLLTALNALRDENLDLTFRIAALDSRVLDLEAPNFHGASS